MVRLLGGIALVVGGVLILWGFHRFRHDPKAEWSFGLWQSDVGAGLVALGLAIVVFAP